MGLPVVWARIVGVRLALSPASDLGELASSARMSPGRLGSEKILSRTSFYLCWAHCWFSKLWRLKTSSFFHFSVLPIYGVSQCESGAPQSRGC